MKIVQIIVAKLVSLLVLVGGALMLAMWFDEDVYTAVKGFLLEDVWYRFGIACGVGLIIMGLLALLPLAKPGRKSTISFPGTHGEVTIQLDSVEETLSRVVSKMPEVKKISVRVTPSEDNHRAQVTADVLMYKGAGSPGAREIANRISDYLADTAVNVLGVEDVTTVNLNVRGIIVGGAEPSIARTKTEPAKEPAPAAEPVEASRGFDEPRRTAKSDLLLGASTATETPARPAPSPELEEKPEENTSFQSLGGVDAAEGEKDASEKL